jgi:hypothetical protein
MCWSLVLLLATEVVEAEEEDRARPKNREMRLRRERWVVVEVGVRGGELEEGPCCW